MSSIPTVNASDAPNSVTCIYGERGKSKEDIVIDPIQCAENLAAEFDEAFNTLFDELDKLPKEHRAKALDTLSQTPWFNRGQKETCNDL